MNNRHHLSIPQFYDLDNNNHDTVNLDIQYAVAYAFSTFSTFIHLIQCSRGIKIRCTIQHLVLIHMSHHPYKILGTLIHMSAIHIIEFVQKNKNSLTKDSYIYTKNVCCNRKKREGVMRFVKIKKVHLSVIRTYLIGYIRYSQKISNFSGKESYTVSHIDVKNGFFSKEIIEIEPNEDWYSDVSLYLVKPGAMEPFMEMLGKGDGWIFVEQLACLNPYHDDYSIQGKSTL